MRAYRVTARNTDRTHVEVRFAPSEAEARATRNAMMAQLQLPKKCVEIVGVEIPTAKTELLPWLTEAFKPFSGTVNG